MGVKQIRFKVGDVVRTPRGAVSTITHIGEWWEGKRKIREEGLYYRVLGSYWSDWQLRKVEDREAANAR